MNYEMTENHENTRQSADFAIFACFVVSATAASRLNLLSEPQ